SLDPGHAIDVMQKLQSLAKGGMSLVVVMHDLTLAARHCDRLVLLNARKIAADGPPAKVLTPERLAAGFGIRAFYQETQDGPLIVPVDRVGGGEPRSGAVFPSAPEGDRGNQPADDQQRPANGGDGAKPARRTERHGI